MKLNNKHNKGFTIVELVIVIAVIAILAAVLIPTFSKIIKKAQQSSDTQLIRNLNMALALDLAEKEEDTYNTCKEAFDAAEEAGYNVAKIVSKSGYNIAYEMKSGHFVLLNEQEGKVLYPVDLNTNEEYVIETEEEKVDYFVVRYKVNDENYIAPEHYSLYAGTTFKAQNIVLNGVGFDAGVQDTIKNVTYNGTTTAKKVVINTNSANTNITINAPLDEVAHYGKAGSVVIESIKPSSYDEFGETAWLELTSGRVVLNKEANVQTMYIAKTSDTTFADKVIITLEDDVKLPEFSRDAITIDQTNGTKVCTIETSDDKKDVYLFFNGIYEQIKVADTDVNNAEKNWITQSNSNTQTIIVAEDIANMFNNKKYNEYGGTNDAPKLNNDKTIKEEDLTKVNNDTFSSTNEEKDNQKKQIVEKAQNAELGGIVVSSSAELKTQLENLKADLAANPEKCNEEVVIILKPAEDQYRDKFYISQYPEWNGLYTRDGNVSNIGSTHASALKSKIRITATEGTIFGGQFTVNGFGYSRGSDPEYSTDVIYTIFDGITFDQSYWNEYKDGALTEKVKDSKSIWQPIIGTGASSNVIIDNCTFIHTGRLQNGNSDAGGGYSYGFVCKNCTFTETDCVIQGYMHGQNTVMLDNITATNTESFLVVTGGGDAPIKINNCRFTGKGHFIRIQTNAEVTATNCTINIINENDANKKGAIVLYRNGDSGIDSWEAGSVKLDSCSFVGSKLISVYNDKDKNQTFNTSITIENCKGANNSAIATESDLNIYNPNSTSGTKTIIVK